MYEVKKVYQNIDISFDKIEKEELIFQIKIFSEIFSNYYLDWEILEKGKIINTGSLRDINVNPRENKSFKIGIEDFEFKKSDLYINISIKLKNSEQLIKKDFEIAREQLNKPS